MVVLLLALLGGWGGAVITGSGCAAAPRRSSTAVGVRSEIRVPETARRRRLLAADEPPQPPPRLGRTRWLSAGAEPRVLLTPNTHNTDTLRIRAPKVGETASGYSCVAAVHGPRLSRETCTPWQYVRPMAQAPSAPVVVDTAPHAARKQARAQVPVAVVRIVIQPAGQQGPGPRQPGAAWRLERAAGLDRGDQEAVPDAWVPMAGRPSPSSARSPSRWPAGQNRQLHQQCCFYDRLYQWIRGARPDLGTVPYLSNSA
jgi:hypothetical protein